MKFMAFCDAVNWPYSLSDLLVLSGSFITYV